MSPDQATPAIELRDCAVVVQPDDNVAVVKRELSGGERVRMSDGREIEVTGPVTPGHRFATQDVPEGAYLRQYGQPIGTSLGIALGDPVSPANMSNDVPVVRELPEDLANDPPVYLPESEIATFMGFKRPDGRVGTRNWILIVPTSMCSSTEATQIATLAEFTLWSREQFPNVDGVVAISHARGCGCQDGSTIDLLLRTLSNYADHPNVGGAVLIDLGCEKTNLNAVDRHLRRTGGFGYEKPVAWVSIQDSGGTPAAVQKGLDAVKDMLPKVNSTSRTEQPASELVLGVKCGSSDGFSGISCNPALGRASDQLVRSGGSVIITEIPEFCGAEHVMAHRARDAKVGRDLYAAVDWFKDYAGRFGGVLNENPSPGNVRGGLLNIAIKSLGAIAKAGTTRIESIVSYSEPPQSKGLHVMQGPGYDQESTPGLVGAGANVLVFTTGNGTTIGNAICPVIKLSSNTRTFVRMKSDIDLSAGGIIDGTRSIDEVGQDVYEHILKVASGTPALAEVNKHREFQVWAEWTVSL
ncbi:MAG: galactonate dehydratase [Planctomycetes bacterium]|nr:galactonate dehydratase [Planctomycetota bacterium]